MIQRPRLVFLLSVIALLTNLCNAQDITNARAPFTIAIVRDGDSPYFDQLAELTKNELTKLADGEFSVAFDTSPEYNANWQRDRIEATLDRALANTNIDLVLAAGYLTAQAASAPDKPLRIPVISGFVQDTDLFEQPLDDLGHSIKTNYTFVLIPRSSKKEIDTFAGMISFTNLGILVDALFAENPSVQRAIKAYEQESGKNITLIPMGTSAPDVIAQFTPSLDALYLTPPMRMSEADWRAVIAAANARKLPTFSMTGQYDVPAGALAGIATQEDDKLARRLALNIQQIMLDTPPEKLYVPMNVKEELLINAKTAQLLDYAPSYEILLQATCINEEFLDTGEPLNIDQALILALENNASLAIETASVEAMKQQRNKSATPLLPQLNGNGMYSRIDDERARASMGTQPREKTTLGFQATQIIYNDPVLTGYRVYERYYKGSLFQQESTRLDTLLNAATAYISLLQAQTLSRVQRENLKLTLSNLELAQVRHNVGTAGPEEVYRWQAQSVQDKASYLSALSSTEQARIALNRVLGYPLDTQWAAKDISNEDSLFLKSADHIGLFLKNEKQKDAFDEYIVNLSLKNAPELQAIDKQIEARKLMLNQAKRRFILPEFGASFDFDHTLDQEFSGQTPETEHDDAWMLGVQATLPLFEGGGRIYTVSEQAAELEKLIQTRRDIAQQLEQRTRSILASLESTQPSMLLQQEAADYSDKNYSVVKDKYARGVISILDLLDAQNQAFIAHQNAAIARYSFLIDIYQLQRTIGWFEAEHTPQQRQTWFNQIENAIQ
jgi:outer membrane protein TolC